MRERGKRERKKICDELRVIKNKENMQKKFHKVNNKENRKKNRENIYNYLKKTRQRIIHKIKENYRFIKKFSKLIKYIDIES